jgi:RNA polymerase sigma-70 factor, ECF subfamily
LHDLFGVSFEEIASIVGRSIIAARQLASRARKRMRGSAATMPGVDLTRQREVVNAFIAAAREGDFDALLAVLDPDVVLRADRGPQPGASIVIRGARTVAERAMMFVNFAPSAREVVVNGAAGIVSYGPHGQPFAIIGYTVSGGKIVEMDILADPVRVRQIDLTALNN